MKYFERVNPWDQLPAWGCFYQIRETMSERLSDMQDRASVDKVIKSREVWCSFRVIVSLGPIVLKWQISRRVK